MLLLIDFLSPKKKKITERNTDWLVYLGHSGHKVIEYFIEFFKGVLFQHNESIQLRMSFPGTVMAKYLIFPILGGGE